MAFWGTNKTPWLFSSLFPLEQAYAFTGCKDSNENCKSEGMESESMFLRGIKH